MQQFAEDGANHHCQHDGGHIFHFEHQRNTKTNGAQAEGHRQRRFDALGELAARRSADESADNHGGSVYIWAD